MKCPHCGMEIPDGSTFCPYCGKKIVIPTEGSGSSYSSKRMGFSSEPPSSSPVPQGDKPPAYSSTYSSSSSFSTPSYTSEPDSKMLLIVIIGVLGLLFMCLCPIVSLGAGVVLVLLGLGTFGPIREGEKRIATIAGVILLLLFLILCCISIIYALANPSYFQSYF